jgi:uncharacterized protein YbjQ (UPF0145 family)
MSANFVELAIQIGGVLFLLFLGYVFGRLAEARHYRSLARREEELRDVVLVSCRTLPQNLAVRETALVTGNVVISVDYYKRALAMIRLLFGGRVRSYESLLERARREALVRLREQAQMRGARMVFNIRLETASISKTHSGAVGSLEVLAYGTAVA